MAITAQMVKALREKTGVGMMDCKKALAECDGNEENAIKYLREKGLAKAAKKAGRATSEGLVGTYTHSNGKLVAMVELKCETDFVAKAEQFIQLSKDLAMQVAATSPVCVKPEDLPQEMLEKEKEIYKQQAIAEGKPENIAEKIVEGRVNKYYKEVCLLEQPFIKDDKKTIKDLLNDTIAVLGENMQIGRFARINLAEAVAEESEAE
ncbi:MULTISPECIES: translation elongation factor Ts [Maridesulfovibrio]|uniref:Elongation factor Ts n=1 Tax=Maridesulfovibrio salexigens (strain ATCC 14822 / DSM 2638 / NCIMB 8403 / VKM B-1763) TaxID=526222 RepID=EFTS_MARSD|nr:translation elongation factor Ts [Maridesulfovibrio salexigens]C6C1T0.1 RecName: Full=Elongation factor Ts; Short=EF-Ts [Maridesulfovibrio salexigens DSM 2638]ACS79326.1 translation elongation factor Ts [Maridesulfovibrio salexigens DSM 2638]